MMKVLIATILAIVVSLTALWAPRLSNANLSAITRATTEPPRTDSARRRDLTSHRAMGGMRAHPPGSSGIEPAANHGLNRLSLLSRCGALDDRASCRPWAAYRTDIGELSGVGQEERSGFRECAREDPNLERVLAVYDACGPEFRITLPTRGSATWNRGLWWPSP